MAAEHDIAAEHEALLQFIYLAPVGVVQFGNAGDIDMINPMSAQLLMPLAPDGVMTNLFDVLDAVAPELRVMVATFPGTHGSVCRDHRIPIPHGRRPDGIPQVLAVTLLRLNGDRLIGLVADISETVLQETRYRENQAWLSESLRLAKEAAEAANDAKTEFLSNISHELRTPMHAISSFAKLGLDRSGAAPRDKLQRYFSNIDGSAERLGHLLTDLLDLAKLEAGRMRYERSPVDIGTLLQDCVAEFDAVARSRGITIDLRIGGRTADGGATAEVDRGSMRKVFANLLSNAVRYSPDNGRIQVMLDVEEGGAAGRCIVVRVADQGPGIPPDELELVFDKFVQSSKTKTGSGGTGLGLAIAREILAAHGGTVRAANRPAGGAEFRVELPVGAAPTAPTASLVSETVPDA